MPSTDHLALFSNKISTLPSTAGLEKTSKNQQDFGAVLGQQVGTDNAKAAERFVQLAENPALSGVLSANGGFGLQSFLSSAGMLDGDGTLTELCRKLESAMQVRGAGASESMSLGCRPGVNRMGGSGKQSRMTMNSRTAGKAAAGIGGLCERFESGEMGVAAVGYDSVGGTSYGLYQIASGVGSMDKFLKYLDGAAPDVAQTLRAAGPANTGSRDGEMPKAWRELAWKDPKRFGALQRDFISKSHYEPAAEAIKEQTGIDMRKQSPVMQEVLWSTAVQHGPSGAARIFGRAIENLREQGVNPGATGKRFETGMVREIYQNRANQFGSSSERVQGAVRNRFQMEQELAMRMLGNAAVA